MSMPSGQLNGVIRKLHRMADRHSLDACSDAELMDHFVRNQDEYAFELIVRRHGPMVLGVCRRILGQTQDAEDAFQATFLVLVRKASCVHPFDMVGNWLYGVACRTAMKAKAMASRRPTPQPFGDPMDRQSCDSTDTWSDVQAVLDEETRAIAREVSHRADLV